MWKLHAIYDAVGKPPLQPTVEDWVVHMSLLRRWTTGRPSSITALSGTLQKAIFNYNYAWDVRGQGYADSVSRSGGTLFEQPAAQAS